MLLQVKDKEKGLAVVNVTNIAKLYFIYSTEYYSLKLNDDSFLFLDEADFRSVFYGILKYWSDNEIDYITDGETFLLNKEVTSVIYTGTEYRAYFGESYIIIDTKSYWKLMEA